MQQASNQQQRMEDDAITRAPPREEKVTTTENVSAVAEDPHDTQNPGSGTQAGNSGDRRCPRELPRTLRLSDQRGTLFDNAPPNTVLIHACNTEGEWGAGIAKVFAKKYPQAELRYKQRCDRAHRIPGPPLVGTCFIISPVENDQRPRHYIACLFTSSGYGKQKDAPHVIVNQTVRAMRDFLEKLEYMIGAGHEVAGLRMCKINSGKFGVPWGHTSQALTTRVNFPHSIPFDDVEGTKSNIPSFCERFANIYDSVVLRKLGARMVSTLGAEG